MNSVGTLRAQQEILEANNSQAQLAAEVGTIREDGNNVMEAVGNLATAVFEYSAPVESLLWENYLSIERILQTAR